MHGRVGGVDCGGMVDAAEEAENIVKIVLEHDAYALGGVGCTDVIVLVVVVVVGFQANGALAIEEIFDVEVADELVGVERFVAITEVAVEEQSVIEQS